MGVGGLGIGGVARLGWGTDLKTSPRGGLDVYYREQTLGRMTNP